jgi:hypothetical protein
VYGVLADPRQAASVRALAWVGRVHDRAFARAWEVQGELTTKGQHRSAGPVDLHALIILHNYSFMYRGRPMRPCRAEGALSEGESQGERASLSLASQATV